MNYFKSYYERVAYSPGWYGTMSLAPTATILMYNDIELYCVGYMETELPKEVISITEKEALDIVESFKEHDVIPEPVYIDNSGSIVDISKCEILSTVTDAESINTSEETGMLPEPPQPETEKITRQRKVTTALETQEIWIGEKLAWRWEADVDEVVEIVKVEDNG